MPITPLIHLTIAYSNAVLVAILPHVSDCAKRLDLPIPQPITASQVAHFNVSPLADKVGGSLSLTNGYSFGFGNGFVNSFHSPIDWFDNTNDDWADTKYFKRYLGKDNLTTNEAIELARHAFRELGYKPEDFQLENSPTRFEGSLDVKGLGGHIPFCRIEWDSPDSRIQSMLGLGFSIQFDVDMQHKRVAGMSLISRRFFRLDPKIDVVPEPETNYEAAGIIGLLAQTLDRAPHIHITPAYSNATLAVTLPYVSSFIQKLGLPVSQPLTGGQIILYNPPAYLRDGFQCSLMLTNLDWFSFVAGYINEFGSSDNWFEEKGTRTDWPLYSGKDCLTTNEAIEFARDAFRKLGYKPEDFHMDVPPTTYTNATGVKQYAYCQIDWDSPEGTQGDEYHMEFDINLQNKQIVGMLLMSKGFFRPEPKIDVIPELESDFRKKK